MPVRKHGAHLITLSMPAAAAGSASDTVGAMYTYNAYPGGAATANATGGVDSVQDWVLEANLVTYANLTGQATNFVSLRLTQVNSSGTVVNRIRVIFNAAGVAVTANQPMNYAVASGATVTNAGTGTLTVDTNVALPWPLNFGDQIVLDRLSNNATGLATPAVSATFLVGAKT